MLKYSGNYALVHVERHFLEVIIYFKIYGSRLSAFNNLPPYAGYLEPTIWRGAPVGWWRGAPVTIIDRVAIYIHKRSTHSSRSSKSYID